MLGVFAASLLEPLFIGSLDFTTAFVVGLIEEFAKILGILVIAPEPMTANLEYDEQMGPE